MGYAYWLLSVVITQLAAETILNVWTSIFIEHDVVIHGVLSASTTASGIVAEIPLLYVVVYDWNHNFLYNSHHSVLLVLS